MTDEAVAEWMIRVLCKCKDIAIPIEMSDLGHNYLRRWNSSFERQEGTGWSQDGALLV